jgi:hypothetical protein
VQDMRVIMLMTATHLKMNQNIKCVNVWIDRLIN